MVNQQTIIGLLRETIKFELDEVITSGGNFNTAMLEIRFTRDHFIKLKLDGLSLSTDVRDYWIAKQRPACLVFEAFYPGMGGRRVADK